VVIVLASDPSSPVQTAGICQTAMGDETGMIGTQMGRHNRSGNVHRVWGALYDTTP
jgi:hypothetical protein